MHTSPDLSDSLKTSASFFLLVFALSLLFWMLGAATDLQIMPGLSMSALTGFFPMVAALMLVYRDKRASAACAVSFIPNALDVYRFFYRGLGGRAGLVGLRT